MNSTTFNEIVLRSKRKQQSLPSIDDPLTDKKTEALGHGGKGAGQAHDRKFGIGGGC